MGLRTLQYLNFSSFSKRYRYCVVTDIVLLCKRNILDEGPHFLLQSFLLNPPSPPPILVFSIGRPNGVDVFVFCRLHPLLSHPPWQCLGPLYVVPLHLTNTVSRGAGLPIHMMGEVSWEPKLTTSVGLFRTQSSLGRPYLLHIDKEKKDCETGKEGSMLFEGGGGPQPIRRQNKVRSASNIFLVIFRPSI